MSLDEKLKNDSYQLGRIDNQQLLLMNNSLVPWFIIVPNTTEIELYRLDALERSKLERNIDLLSEHIIRRYSSEKLNIATIGNIVHQLHIHVIGRTTNDYCWPDVVWGQKQKKPYSKDEVIMTIDNLKKDIDVFVENNHLYE